jgi:Holliday junction resolvase
MLDKSRKYETSVAMYLVNNNPDFLVRYNQFIKGKFSQVKRQIDILLVNNKRMIVVECKYYNKKVNIKIIEEFIAFLEDVGINEGLLITNIGVTKSVINRISESEIDIKILSEKDLGKYNLTSLMPYEGNRALFIYEPYGWQSIGAVPELHTCCFFIPIGSYLEDYNAEGNFLYLNLFDKNYSVDESINIEIKNINTHYSGKKKHTLLKNNDMFYRNSYLYNKGRYDITLIKYFPIGYAVIHGILKPSDLNWSITAMKKMLNKAIMIENIIKLDEFGKSTMGNSP